MLMAHSIFTLGFFGQTGFFRPQAGIPVYRMTREQVDHDRSILKRLPVPPGMAVMFPYVVKIDGEGEYLVQADGMAVFLSYRDGRAEPPVIVDNRSYWNMEEP